LVTKTDDSGQFTRRKFIRIIGLLTFLSLLIPATYSYFLRKGRKKIPFTPRNLLKGEFEFFTPYQATLVEEVTSLIIPTDNDPGAREAGAVFELDRIVSGSDKLKQLYIEGIEWLDYMAKKISNKESFIDLSHDEKIKILQIADSGRLPYIHKVYLFIKYRNTRIARTFFSIIKEQTFESFYTSEIGWKVVGYQGPPQWSGHLDYYKCP
jgi:hypothetical protein